MTSTRLLEGLLVVGLLTSSLFAQGPMHKGEPGMGRPPGGGPMMGGGPPPGSPMTSSSAPITGAPYSAIQTVVTQQTLANGTVIQNQQQTKVFRDGKGRTRTESSFSPGSGAPQEVMITIADPAANSTIRLDPQRSTAARSFRPFSMPPPRGDHGRGGDPGNRGEMDFSSQTTELGTKSISGLSATGTRVTLTIPTGAIGNNQPIPIVRETWVSTELKVPVLITSSDPRFGTSTMKLTDIVRSEPDAALFSVPADYSFVNDRGGPPDGGRNSFGPGSPLERGRGGPMHGPDDRRPPRFGHE